MVTRGKKSIKKLQDISSASANQMLHGDRTLHRFKKKETVAALVRQRPRLIFGHDTAGIGS